MVKITQMYFSDINNHINKITSLEHLSFGPRKRLTQQNLAFIKSKLDNRKPQLRTNNRILGHYVVSVPLQSHTAGFIVSR